MLTASITITTSSGTPGNYTCNALFSDSSKAKYLRIGDTLEDREGKTYEILTHSAAPGDFSSGGTLTLTQLTGTASAPTTFAVFGDASIYTPGQVDVRPAMQSGGNVFSQTLNSGQNYRYSITASWFDTGEAANSAPGDYLTDSIGKLYVIVTKDNTNFTSGIIEEVEKEGIPPAVGSANIFTPTPNQGYYQGTALSDPARTYAFNRDKFLIDSALNSFGSSSGELIQGTFTNNSGSLIEDLIVVRQDSSGNIATVDISQESEVLKIIGVTSESISNGASGSVVFKGRILDVTTSFDLADILYLSDTGTLTTTVPDIGIGTYAAGDFIVRVGQILKNNSNPANKDFFVDLEIVGVL